MAGCIRFDYGKKELNTQAQVEFEESYRYTMYMERTPLFACHAQETHSIFSVKQSKGPRYLGRQFKRWHEMGKDDDDNNESQ